MAIREGRWDCQYCGKLGNLGRHRACKNCGSSRPDGTKFYLADDAEITEKHLLRQAQLGPDWVCEYCGTSNAADITVCGSCGAPREATTPSQQVKEYGLDETPDSGDMTFDEPPSRPEPQTEAKPKKRSKVPLLAIAGVIGAIVLLCLVIFAALLLSNREAEAEVSGFRWERTVDIERFETVTEEDWEVPSGGRILSQRQEIHHYNQVVDHYETREEQVPYQVQVGERSYVCGQRDLGNGFFEDVECTEPVYETEYRTESVEEAVYREEPVYQTLYVFELDKWVVVRTESASERDHSPFWPRSDLGDGEREGDKDESYYVIFIDSEGKTHEWETSEDNWQSLEQGQLVTLKLNALGDISDIER